MTVARRLDAYIRVSRVAGREGESFISPSVQLEQIAGWAKLRGVEIAESHEDLDQSGGKLSRPGLDALLERIESGQTEGVVVAKLDRLSRLGVGDALKLVERITDAGGSIAAIDLGLDPTTPFGEFGMTIMLAMARMERRRLSDSWAIARERAIARGVMVTRTPLGYSRKEDGTLAIDLEESVHVRRAYDLAAGQGIHAAYEYLAERLPNRWWTTATARRLLANRAYLGESRHGDMLNAEAHPPLVSRAIWEAAQHDPRSYQRASRDYPLSGLIRCDTCGGPMAAGPMRKGGKRAYRCSAVQTLHRGKRCPEGASIMAEPLEEVLRDELQVLFAGFRAETTDGTDEVVLAERAVTEAEAELESFAADLTARRLLADRYHENLSFRARAVEDAKATYRALTRQSQAAELLTGEQALDDPRVLATLLRGMRLSVRVRRGRAPARERVIVSADDDRSTGE